MIRLLLVGVLAVGCHRSPDTDNISSSITHPALLPPLPSSSKPKPKPKPERDALWRHTHTCLEGIATDQPVRERLSLAVTQCLAGLRREDPFDWRIEHDGPVVIAERRFSTPTCARFALAADPWATLIRAELLDESDNVLADSTQTNLLFLPSTGVLCLPEGSHLRLRVQTKQPPVTGLGNAAFGH
jgi:hypothetical protein